MAFQLAKRSSLVMLFALRVFSQAPQLIVSGKSRRKNNDTENAKRKRPSWRNAYSGECLLGNKYAADTGTFQN